MAGHDNYKERVFRGGISATGSRDEDIRAVVEQLLREMTRLPSPKIVTDSVVVEGEQYPPMSIVGEVTNSVKPVTPNETTGKVIAISSRLTHKDSALGNQLRRKRLEKQVA